MDLYKYNGEAIPILDSQNRFDENYTLSYHYDEQSDSFYSLLRINQTKTDGSKQFPFVRYLGSNNMSTPRLLYQREPWNLIINSGWYSLEIENSVVKMDLARNPQDHFCALTIDRDGNLGYAVDWADGAGAEMVANGIVSATTLFFPLIVDYEPYDYPSTSETETERWQHAQRQIIGQYGNGDYAIITSEGRGYQNSIGITPDRCIEICQSLGLRFAFNLDGGGSTQTVIGGKTLNSIYEGTDGRLVPAFIVFNGTTQFRIPE